MGTFIGMSESHKGITTALKQLPMCHTIQKLNLKYHTTRVNPKYTIIFGTDEWHLSTAPQGGGDGRQTTRLATSGPAQLH
jgi:hypothetical protein